MVYPAAEPARHYNRKIFGSAVRKRVCRVKRLLKVGKANLLVIRNAQNLIAARNKPYKRKSYG